MVFQWFLSRTVRKATELRQHVQRLLNEQRDLLSAAAIDAISAALGELRRRLKLGAGSEEIRTQMTRVVEAADQWLHPYPHPGLRENVKEFVGAATVILALTTFFLQLTKIPTGSMQPTLFGITEEDLRDQPQFRMPDRLSRLAQYWFKGISYCQITARADGVLRLRDVEPPKLVFPFVKKQRLRVGDQWYTIWFPPDQLVKRARLFDGQSFRAGEDIIRMKVVVGDHLLVDRFTFNFRRPERGEIIVFKTRGIDGLVQDQLYIKRLVALSGERVRIGNDQHLIINGRRLDAATPRFENVYTFSSRPGEHRYFGHVNQAVANRCGGGSLAPLFLDETREYSVGPRHYLAMGDNTLNSLDSRSWGGLPQGNVIGKCWFVYWPFTERFGWGNR